MAEDQKKQKKLKKIIISNYELLKLIGVGSFGQVYLANHIPTNFKVAIKIVNIHKNPRIKSKYDILKELNHINIIKIFDYFEKYDKSYIVFEYISGGELFTQIETKGHLKQIELSTIFFQLIKILKYLHKKNIYHRDLKLENILLSKNNLIKLIDFGSAIKQNDISINSSKNNLLLTKCGSINYCAPEILKGVEYNGKMADIWSLGVILYVLSTGSLPFDENNESELIKKIIKCKINYPVDMPINIKTIIMKILVSDPNKRLTINELEKCTLYRKGKEIFFNENILYDRDSYKLKKIINDKLDEYINEYNNKNVNNLGNDVLYSNSFQSILKAKIFYETNWNKIILEETIRKDFNIKKIKHALSSSILKNKNNTYYKNKTISNRLNIFRTLKKVNLFKNLEDNLKLLKRDNNNNLNYSSKFLNTPNYSNSKRKKNSAKKKLNHSTDPPMYNKIFKKINNKERLYLGNYSNSLNKVTPQNTTLLDIKYNTLNNNINDTHPNYSNKKIAYLFVNKSNSKKTIDTRIKSKKINLHSNNRNKIVNNHKYKLTIKNKTNNYVRNVDSKNSPFSTIKKSINDSQTLTEIRKRRLIIDYKNYNMNSFNNTNNSPKKNSKNIINMISFSNNGELSAHNLNKKKKNNILLINSSRKNRNLNGVKTNEKKNLVIDNIMNTIRNDKSNFHKFRKSIKKYNLSHFRKVEINKHLNTFSYNESNYNTTSILKEKNNLNKTRKNTNLLKSYLDKANVYRHISKKLIYKFPNENTFNLREKSDPSNFI